MRKMIITGLFAAVVAAFAAAAAPAMAHEFIAEQSKGIIQDKGGLQTFATGGAKVECNEEESKGIIQAKHEKIAQEKVDYKGCKAFGAAATVSEAKYGFSAEGTVAVESEVTIKVPEAKCEIKVPSAGNQELSKVTYTNISEPQAIEIKAEVTGITSSIAGSGVACVIGKNSSGKYEGTSVAQGWQCLPVGSGGHYRDPYCWVVEFGGLYQLFRDPLHWQ